MKYLYAKVIPEIAKFEQRIIDFETQVEKTNLIMRQFDETIAHKSDKILVEQIKLDCNNNFASKEEQVKAIERMNNSI